MAVLSKGSLFPTQLVTEMFNNVKGKSSLAVLSAQTPIPFNGQTEFIFTMDKEIDIVAENGAKSNGGATVTPVTMIPIKFEYGARISNEFMYASEEVQLQYLQSFANGFSKKLAKGLDIAALHGVNPRTGKASTVVGDNHFDKKIDQSVTYVAAQADENVDSAVALIEGFENDATGMIMAPAFRSALAALKTTDGAKLYPELAWGSKPGVINGLPVDVNSTVAANASKDKAFVGDFANAFKWGYSKEIPLEVIEYGNPDNDEEAGDLKGHNQVYLRAEAFLGWGILDPNAFAKIADA
ncbi:MAG: phage major capsid protein [Anaerostipes sp.]|nr:phage major capsid protein [Anaerostipes sp.]